MPNFSVYVVIEAHHMGMDGDYHTISGIYAERYAAEKRVTRLENNHDRRGENQYDWTDFYVEEHLLMAEVKNA